MRLGFCFRLAVGRFILQKQQRRGLMNQIEDFYVSWTWRRCRKAFAESKGNLCEDCLRRGIIEPGSKDRPLEVHHKIPLNADNFKNPEIALNWNNLQLLCKDCHEAQKERKPKRWQIGPDGRVILIIPPG